jgi:GT2 family glycosyltransferase
LEKENTLHQLAPNRRLVLVRSGENLGIAGGYNVGIRYALGRQFEYIWIMNNDTVIDPSCVDLCVRTFDSDHRIGVVGPKILWYDDPSRIWYAGARLRLRRGDIADVGIGELDGDDYSGIRITEFVSGCALLTRRETLEEVGLLDENFFALHEDVDWSYRVQRTSHFTLAANLDAQVWHKEGGISSSGRVSAISTYFANKNRFLVVSKHGSWSEKFSFAMFYLLSRPMKFLLLLAKGKKHLVRAELKAMIHFLTGQYGLSDRERISSWRRR